MKGLTVILLCLGLTYGYKTYEGYQVFRVNTASVEDIQFLNTVSNEMSLDVWLEAKGPGHHMDLMAAPHQITTLQQHLQGGGLTYRVLIANVNGAILKERDTTVDRLTPRAMSNPPDETYYTVYHTMAEIDAWIDTMAADYPALTSIFNVGTTYEGRSMRGHKLSTGGSGKPAAWFECGIHPREWISPAVCLYFTAKLLADYGVDATATNLLDTLDIYVLPVFNQDGYVYTWGPDRMWRKTRSPNAGSKCNGTDPNRNWDNQWQGAGARNGPCTQTFPGARAFSEQEVQAVANYMGAIDNLQLALDIHSYSQYYMMPYGYQQPPPTVYDTQSRECDRAVADLQAVHGMSYKCGTIYSLVGQAYGSSVDYMFDVAGAQRSYAIELRDTGAHGFLLPADQILPTCEENYAAFTSLLKDILP